ncbi:hypothetical protein SK128_009665, partial [Halocaridina rubra]
MMGLVFFGSLAALVTSLSSADNAHDELIRLRLPPFPSFPPFPAFPSFVSPPKTDTNLLKLLSLDWPRPDTSDFLEAVAVEMTGDSKRSNLRKRPLELLKDRLTAFVNKHKIE